MGLFDERGCIKSHLARALGVSRFKERNAFLFRDRDIDAKGTIDESGVTGDGAIEKIAREQEIVVDSFDRDAEFGQSVDSGFAIIDGFRNFFLGESLFKSLVFHQVFALFVIEVRPRIKGEAFELFAMVRGKVDIKG